MRQTTHLHVELRLKFVELYLHSPICLHDKHRDNSISILKTFNHSVCTASNTRISVKDEKAKALV
jgi:hypothetical protein